MLSLLCPCLFVLLIFLAMLLQLVERAWSAGARRTKGFCKGTQGFCSSLLSSCVLLATLLHLVEAHIRWCQVHGPSGLTLWSAINPEHIKPYHALLHQVHGPGALRRGGARRAGRAQRQPPLAPGLLLC